MNQPPIRPLQATLPFGDLTGEEFENAVRDLMRKSGFANVEFRGASGDEQAGVDVTGDRDALHWGVSAKRHKTFGYKATKAAIRKTTYAAGRYVLALSRKATVGAQKAIAEHHEAWELWDRVRLSDMVRDLPHDTAVTYIEQHFHHAHVETFLGRPRATTFVDRETYFASFKDPQNLRFHGLTRVGPSAPLDALQVFLQSSGARVAIVSGSIGIGKSKLVYDFTAADGNLEARQPYFMLNGATLTAEALREVRSDRSIVIVDDADQLSSVTQLVSHCQRVDTKVILLASAHGLAALRERLLQIGMTSESIVGIHLTRLGRDDTVALARQVFGRELPIAENAIVMHASESPLNSILLARVIRDRSESPATEREVEELSRALFSDVLAGATDPSVPRADIKAVLSVVAAASPARLESDEWLESAQRFLGWDERDRLLQALDAIDDTGILARRGGLYYVPEFLRNQIIREAAVSTTRVTAFPKNLYQAFGAERNWLRNLAIAERDIVAAGGPRILEAAWQEVDKDARSTYSLQRTIVLDALVDVAYVKPREVLELVEYLADHPAINDADQPLAELGRVGHDSVLRHIPAVLHGIMVADNSYIPRVVKRMWHLGKDEDEITFSADPLRVIKSFASYKTGFDEGKARAIVGSIAEMIAEGESDTPKHSLLDLIRGLLSRDIFLSLPGGGSFSLRRLVLDVSRLQAVRDETIAVCAAALAAEDDRRADRAIDVLSDLLREPENLVTAPSATVAATWDRERATAFDAFDALVSVGTWPLRELRLGTKLRWFARHSPSQLVKSRAQAILAKIVESPERNRYRILAQEFLRPEYFRDLRAASDFDKAGQAQGELISRTVEEWTTSIPEVDAFLDDLSARIEAVRRAGLSATARHVFSGLVHANPQLAQKVLDRITETADSRFPDAAPLIAAVFAGDLREGEATAERLLDQGKAELAIALAEGLDPNLGDDAAIIQERLLRKLLSHEHVEVRRSAVRALMFFGSRHGAYAVDLVLSTDLDADAKLADDAYMVLGSVELPTDERLQAIVRKLENIPTLEYWPLHLLARIAQLNPETVFDLFSWRIRNGSGDLHYQPLPFVDHELDAVLRQMVASDWFKEHGDRRIRELQKETPRSRRFYVEHFYAAIGRASPPVLKAAIEEALNSDDEAEQRAGLGLLAAAPHTSVAGDIEFIVRTGKRAVELGAEFARRYQGALISCLTSGAECVDPYDASPSDTRVQTVAAEALERVDAPALQRLFGEVREWGDRSAQRTIEHSEEQLGPQ